MRIKILYGTGLLLVSCFYFIQVVIYFCTTKSNEKVPVLVWRTSMIETERLITCYKNKYKCLLINKKTYESNISAYLFYGSRIENHNYPLPRNNALWAIFHEESPKNYAAFLYNETQNMFNLTATFSRHSDFPVTLQYLNNLAGITDTKYYMPLKEKNKYLKEISPVLYIQSDCDTPTDRDYLVQELAKYIEIDSYGKCLNNKIFPAELFEVDPLDVYNEKLVKFISKYKFVIAIENAVCDDYVTEKLWRPLAVGSIPIYLGSPTIEDWLPNKNTAILIKNFKNIKDLADHINHINKNDTLYNIHIEHKLKNKVKNSLLKEKLALGPFGLDTEEEHPISAFECFVCRTVHEQKIFYFRGKSISSYNCSKPNLDNNRRRENTWDQHWIFGKCQSMALKFLIDEDRPYSEEIFENTWRNFYANNSC